MEAPFIGVFKTVRFDNSTKNIFHIITKYEYRISYNKLPPPLPFSHPDTYLFSKRKGAAIDGRCCLKEKDAYSKVIKVIRVNFQNLQ